MSLTDVPATQPAGGCWVLPVTGITGNHTAQTAKYVGFSTWGSEAARLEWYDEFSREARTDYERIGHIVDWLRSLVVSADTKYLVLERQDAEIQAMQLEKDATTYCRPPEIWILLIGSDITTDIYGQYLPQGYSN